MTLVSGYLLFKQIFFFPLKSILIHRSQYWNPRICKVSEVGLDLVLECKSVAHLIRAAEMSHEELSFVHDFNRTRLLPLFPWQHQQLSGESLSSYLQSRVMTKLGRQSFRALTDDRCSVMLDVVAMGTRSCQMLAEVESFAGMWCYWCY